MRVYVTQEDIDIGEPDSCPRCPVALALKRATGFSHIRVYLRHAYVAGVKVWLPANAHDFIEAFDAADEMGSDGMYPIAPFHFDIDPPGSLR